MTSAELVWRNAKTNFNGKVVKGMNEKFLEAGDDADFGSKISIQALRDRSTVNLKRRVTLLSVEK